ncbi:MAG: SDR family oxidoreductase [Ilumatobacteraceae bacterium]
MSEATPLGTPSELVDLTGTVIVVTGAGGGIGAGIAQRCSAAGAAVVAHTRTTPIDPSGFVGPVATVEADLTSDDGPATVLAAAVDRFGRVDGLVNNAGIQPVAALDVMHDDEVRAVLDANVIAVHRLTRAVAGHLVERRAPGSIVHVASIEGRQPAPGHVHYAAAKAAVIMHARAAASEYGRSGIRVNSVSPGLIDRPGLQDDWPDGVARWHASVPLARLGRPTDVGDACVFLLSPMARWITGADLVVDGGVLTRPTW